MPFGSPEHLTLLRYKVLTAQRRCGKNHLFTDFSIQKYLEDILFVKRKVLFIRAMIYQCKSLIYTNLAINQKGSCNKTQTIRNLW